MPQPEAMMNMTQKQSSDAFALVYSEIFAVLCSHADAFLCAAQHMVECGDDSASEGGAGMDMSAGSLAAQIGCMCSECPKLPAALGGFLGYMFHAFNAAFQGFAGDGGVTQPTADESLEMICPMINPLKCASESTLCRDELGGFEGLEQMTGLEDNCTLRGYKLEPEDTADGTTSTSPEDMDNNMSAGEEDGDDVTSTSSSTTVILAWLGSVAMVFAVVG